MILPEPIRHFALTMQRTMIARGSLSPLEYLYVFIKYLPSSRLLGEGIVVDAMHEGATAVDYVQLASHLASLSIQHHWNGT
jgi:hypothetical protein